MTTQRVFARQRAIRLWVACIVLAIGSLATAGVQAQASSTTAAFSYREVMIPMRDGARLQTVILVPVGRTDPLPILMDRSPYGVADKAPDRVPTAMQALAADGYIFVLQNVRGRFKSEGVFGLTTLVDMSDPKAVNDATDAYDTIEWLLKNVPGHNGRVGIYGVSYSGMTAALSLLYPHPALKAVSEQGASADQWMNDDFHRYGALRLSFAFEFAVRQQSEKNANHPFDFDTYDVYEWYLKLGPLSNINDKYLKGSLSFWNDVVAHPDYDDYWKKDAWYLHLDKLDVPFLHVVGYWDQEDPWGPWQAYRRAESFDKKDFNYLVAGPWSHGGWRREAKGDRLGLIAFGGQETSREFRESIEAPFFRHFLHGKGAKPDWELKSFQTGSNTWRSYSTWPPAEVQPTKLYLHADGKLSFDPPAARRGTDSYREYVSDPANPVPYRPRPIPPFVHSEWRTWEVGDQRFADGRPDVLTYVSEPLDRDVMVAGEVGAVLFASSSGSDSDFVVKLIDVYPQDAQPPQANQASSTEYAKSLNGYQLPIAMEVRRGRYLESFEKPTPLPANRPVKWIIPLRDHDHVFLKGHRIMVQVQSTWFPLIDRNPQQFVPNIYQAKLEDYVKTTQRVYSVPSQPSHIVLPLLAR